MRRRLSVEAKRELIEAEKKKILDEFVELAGWAGVSALE